MNNNRKILSLILVFAIVFGIFSTAVLSSQATGELGEANLIGIIGDADVDGKISVKDATVVQKHVAKILTLEGKPQKLANFLPSQVINVKCATYIQKYVAKIKLAGTDGEKVGQKLYDNSIATHPAQTTTDAEASSAALSTSPTNTTITAITIVPTDPSEPTGSTTITVIFSTENTTNSTSATVTKPTEPTNSTSATITKPTELTNSTSATVVTEPTEPTNSAPSTVVTEPTEPTGLTDPTASTISDPTEETTIIGSTYIQIAKWNAASPRYDPPVEDSEGDSSVPTGSSTNAADPAEEDVYIFYPVSYSYLTPDNAYATLQRFGRTSKITVAKTTLTLTSSLWGIGSTINTIKDYWEIELSVENLTEIKLILQTSGSNTSPQNFNIQYAYESDNEFTVVETYIVADDNGKNSITATIPNGTDTLIIRLCQIDNVSIGGSTTSGSGTNRIHNLELTGMYYGTITPEPSTSPIGDGEIPENVLKFANGTKSFDQDVLNDYALLYSRVVLSNKPWSWENNFPGKLNAGQKTQIRNQAIALGYIPEIDVKKPDPGTGYDGITLQFGFADFKHPRYYIVYPSEFIIGDSIVEEIVELPKEMWKMTDSKQFSWLDNQIGGKRDGYTWHHTEIAGVMYLVPFGIHNIFAHNGGRTAGMWADAPR